MVSHLWCWAFTNEVITHLNCLQKFQYRGFDIEESAAFYCAEVKVPAFTTGKKQLAGIGVPQKRTAAVRIRENGYLNYVINTKCIVLKMRLLHFWTVYRNFKNVRIYHSKCLYVVLKNNIVNWMYMSENNSFASFLCPYRHGERGEESQPKLKRQEVKMYQKFVDILYGLRRLICMQINWFVLFDTKFYWKTIDKLMIKHFFSEADTDTLEQTSH